MTTVYRARSMVGHEAIVLPVGERYEYHLGRSETELVSCLILSSEDHKLWPPGGVRAFATCGLVRIL